MRFNTRFNPTANGDLHLGHAYTALVNEYEAHASGGLFHVRIADNQIDTLGGFGSMKVALWAARQAEALNWLGLFVDDYQRQSQMDIPLREFVAKHGYFIPEYRFPFSLPLNAALGDYNPELGEWFGYAPYLTYTKVCYDEIAGINLLIRGDDLRSEFCLYQHYRAQLGLKEIKHYYLPRLYGANGEIVSKAHGTAGVLDYRDNGWLPHEVIELLGKSALRDPAKGWRLDNIKKTPRLDPALNIQI